MTTGVPLAKYMEGQKVERLVRFNVWEACTVISHAGFSATQGQRLYKVRDAQTGADLIVQEDELRLPLTASPDTVDAVAHMLAATEMVVDESTLRKMQPVGTIAKNYFPLALRAVAAVSWVGNEKHNPGEPLHWARGKSGDHLDCLGRHMTEDEVWDRVELKDGRVYEVLHSAQAAWRALAICQLEAETHGGEVVRRLK